ncbi:MAG: hypothetical protein JKY82_09520 [Rhizobiaceae bacterium]|nr:hypothetical protein [Rhizobiaceae bacterium]
MKKNPLTINPTDENKFTIEFTREKLSDFVFSLLATPRQERRLYKTGFDLNIDEIKILIDKVQHKIGTDYDILHNDFKADVVFEDETLLSFNSSSQFFATADIRNEKIEQLSLTLSVVIPFNRLEGEKSYEKQTIFILVQAGQVGSVEVDIRSTEITWSAGYFEIIDQHFKKLARSIPSNKNSALDTLLFFHPIFIDDFISEDKKKEPVTNVSRMRLMLTAAMLTMTVLFLGMMLTIVGISRHTAVYNPDTAKIEIVEVDQLIDTVGWERAASMLRDTQTLASKSDIGYAEGSAPKSPFFLGLDVVKSKKFIVAFLGFFVFGFSNLCYARLLAAEKVGRIFLYNDNLPPRPKGSLLIAVLGSLLLGVLGSVLATGVLLVIGYF